MATGDTIEAEDVIRVDQGATNAHTAWALIDAPNRIFVLWERLRADHFDVKWFGAKADWDSVVGAGTDNLPAFVAALGAMKAGGNKTNKLVADGHFFLSDTLVLTQTVVLEGTGMNEPTVGGLRSSPGTWLVFPQDVDGIRIKSAAVHDPGYLISGVTASGEKTIIRNMTITCKDIGPTTVGHGIYMTAPAVIEHVTIEFFGGDGIRATGNLEDDCSGSVDGSLFNNVASGRNKGDGFHTAGGDANVCLFTRCTAITNGGVGYYDASYGNAYVMCHSEGNVLMNYKTELDINRSSFLGCYSEIGPLNNLQGQPSILAGNITGAQLTKDSSAFILSWGTADTRADHLPKHPWREGHHHDHRRRSVSRRHVCAEVVDARRRGG